MKRPCIYLIPLILFLLAGVSLNAMNRDSVLRVANNNSLNDTIRMDAFGALFRDCNPEEKKLAENYFKLGLKLAAKHKSNFVYSRMYGHFSWYFLHKLNDYSSALRYNQVKQDYLLKMKDYADLSSTYHYLARDIYQSLDMVSESIDALKKAIYYARKNKKGSEYYLYYELGWIETFNGYPDSAFVHLSRTMQLINPDDKGFEIELLTWMGNTFVARKQYRKALYYQLKAMHIADSLNDDFHRAETNRYAANAYRELGLKDSATTMLKKTVAIYMKGKDIRLYYAASTLIKWLSRDGHLPDAKNYIDQLNDGSIIDFTKEDEMHSFFLDAKYTYFYASGDYKQAVENLKGYVKLQDSIDARLKRYDVSEQNLKMIFFKQQQLYKLKQQKKNLEVKAELQSQKTFAYGLTGIIALVVLMLIFSIRNTRQKQLAFKEVSIQKKEVERQKLLVEIKNKEVTDSIHYAKRIQSALLAHKEHLDEFVPENFIFFKPKDIVSGDFYWSTKKIVEDESGKEKKLFYFAVCDSTGHGVPGAFMSLLNIGFLSEAISEKNIVNPHEVFAYVRNRLISTISHEQQKDGFDGILMCFDSQKMEVTFAAANNALLHCTNRICTKLDHDRIPVGQSVLLKNFTMQKIQVKKGDVLYLLTDGFADQFGGPKGRRFMSGNLKKLLTDNMHLALHEQCNILDTTFMAWKGEYEQVDDVCVVGLKI